MQLVQPQTNRSADRKRIQTALRHVEIQRGSDETTDNKQTTKNGDVIRSRNSGNEERLGGNW